MADNGQDFRIRATQLANKMRNMKPSDAEVDAQYQPMSDAIDPGTELSDYATASAYARRGVGGPVAAGAMGDVALLDAVTRQGARRQALRSAYANKSAGLTGAYRSLAAQEQVAEAMRRLQLLKEQQEAGMLGDILGTAGMVVGGVLGGPAGAAVGGAVGKTAGSAAGGR